MTWWSEGDTRRRRLALAGLLIITCFLGTRDIGDEASVMLGGDMARYVMNGVFIHDLIGDGGAWSYDELARYAERYYAQYPALSLGHHPPVAYFSTVPFFWVFGVSLFAVRLAALSWFLLAAWGLFAVVTRMYRWQVAAWASALFVTTVVVLRSGQYLLSEMPMAALVLWSVHALLRFCDTRRPLHFVWFVVLAVASLYAKQLAVLMFPVYGVILVTELGWRSLTTPHALIGLGTALALSVPVGIMTVNLAPENFAFALANAGRLLTGGRQTGPGQIIATILSSHLSVPALVLVGASILLLFVRPRRQLVVGVLWIACVVVGSVVFAGSIEPARYAFGATPAYFVLIAGLADAATTRTTRILVAILLSGTLCWQFGKVINVYPSGAAGYETAAEYVLTRAREPAILFDSSIDTGYFVFFVRKHSPPDRQVVLRADKIVRREGSNPDRDREDLHSVLRQFGVRWIVAENRTSGPGTLLTFHDELRTSRFALRERIPVVSTAASGLELLIFEYLEAQPADFDAEVRIDIPLGQRGFAIRLGDLVRPR